MAARWAVIALLAVGPGESLRGLGGRAAYGEETEPRGVVLAEADGRPVAGATVVVTPLVPEPPRDAVRRAAKDTAGDAAAGDSAASARRAEWRTESGGDGLWSEPRGRGLRLVTVTAPGFARTRAVVAGDWVGEIRLPAAASRTISGRVRLPDGVVQMLGEVRARPTDEPWEFPGTSADVKADGTFVLRDVAAGTVTVEFDPVRCWQVVAFDPRSARTGPVEPGTTGLVVQSRPGATISGRVVDLSGVGVRDALVCLLWRSERLEIVHLHTDAHGAFRFTGLDDGLYAISAGVDLRDGWPPTRIDDVRAGTDDLRILLGPPQRVRGTIERPSGLPVDGGRVVACSPGAETTTGLLGSGLAAAEVAADGTFAFSYLPPGPWEFRFSEPAAGRPWRPGISRTASEILLRLAGAECVTPPADGLLLRVDEGAVVRGRVDVAGGVPPEMTAAVRSRRTGESFEAHLAEDGTFEFGGLDADDLFDVAIRHAGGAAWAEVGGVHPNGRPVRLRVDPPRRVRGRILTRDGAPLGDANIGFIACDSTGRPLAPLAWNWGTRTDGDGRFAAEWLLPGDHLAYVKLKEDVAERRPSLEVGVGRVRTSAPPADHRMRW